MTEFAPDSRALAPLPDYTGTAVFLAASAAIGALAYLLIGNWIASNLTLNLMLITISCGVVAYCVRTTLNLYRASDLMDTLDGTVELGQPSRTELLQLSVQAQKVRNILDVKSLRAIIQSIQSSGDFVLSTDVVIKMRANAEKASVSAERWTDAGMLIVPLLALSMGAWSFITDSATGSEKNAAIMSPLMVGFLSASLLVLLNKQSQHASTLFANHLQHWLTLRSAQSGKQTQELLTLRSAIKQLECKLTENERLMQQQAKAIGSLTQRHKESQEIASPLAMQNQEIIQQATDTHRVITTTRKDDRQSFSQNASNDENTPLEIVGGPNNGQDRSAAA
ncbi:MAG: hypothetical protein AAF542_13285 [Pseudomonadota bacterium]